MADSLLDISVLLPIVNPLSIVGSMCIAFLCPGPCYSGTLPLILVIIANGALSIYSAETDEQSH